MRRRRTKSSRLLWLAGAAACCAVVAVAVGIATTGREKKPGDAMLVEGYIKQTSIHIDDFLGAASETPGQDRGVVVLSMRGGREAICHFPPGTAMKVAKVQSEAGSRKIAVRGKFDAYAAGGEIVILKDCQFAGAFANR